MTGHAGSRGEVHHLNSPETFHNVQSYIKFRFNEVTSKILTSPYEQLHFLKVRLWFPDGGSWSDKCHLGPWRHWIPLFTKPSSSGGRLSVMKLIQIICSMFNGNFWFITPGPLANRPGIAIFYFYQKRS